MTSVHLSYPLYDYLLSKVEARKDKAIDINRVCSTINNIERIVEQDELAQQHYREITWLIIHHNIVTGGSETALPYDTKAMVGGKGILVSTNNTPSLLQQILAQYIEYESQD